MNALYKAWRFLQDKIIGYSAALVMLALTTLAVVEIFRRYIEGRTFYWGQDAVTYLIVGAAMLYFGVSQATRAHLAFSALPDWLARSTGIRFKIACVIRMFGSLISLMFVAGFVWWGWPGAERTMMLGRLTESMIIPLWPFQFVCLIGMAMLGITYFFQFYRDVFLLFGRDPFPWDTQHEDFEL
jgi:TRAP-type C4-dicarboxylate transport system permease small subunit